MKRVWVLVVVLLALGASGARAHGPLLRGADARAALVRWSLNHNMVEAEPGPCTRVARDLLRCELTETGWWGEPSDGTWADHIGSWYRITRPRGRRLVIQWIDFAYGPAVE